MLYENFAKKILGGFLLLLFFGEVCFKKQSKGELLLVPGMQSFNFKKKLIRFFDSFL